MFLDDELCSTFEKGIKLNKWIPEILDDLYIVVDQHWKPKIHASMNKSEVATILDKAFNSWDLFIKRIEKHSVGKNTKVSNAIQWIKKHGTYKEVFLSNSDMARIYNECKNERARERLSSR